MNTNDFALDILKLAHHGFCCSQIVMQLALDLQGQSNPGLIRAMSGLCHGIYDTRGTCGALTGAACLIAYYAGKGKADDEADNHLPLMLSELAVWFEEYGTSRFGGINCADIVKDNQPDTAICGGLVSECFGRAMAILMENGFDPASACND
ncbi:MAG: C-GCAxxG-C-C family protein [Desulfoprunum sp.]|nr:C-GCAxxG-C-C family protein [Desulfoprunum sp.]